jgi:microbial collagenase
MRRAIGRLTDIVVRASRALLRRRPELGDADAFNPSLGNSVGHGDQQIAADPSRLRASLPAPDVTQRLEAVHLPNSFVFDDGAMVVRTPLALADIQLLYHAVKAVESQFSRLTQTIAPLPGDPTDVLTIVLFGSRDAYQKHGPVLYGIPTDNGGIYVEPRGTFYTYDRTPREDLYPLEELFRHEFAHYLVGRFLVGGMWGQAPIYQDGRMRWFDEGLAEFCTWSTTEAGIKPRKRLVELVRGDGQNRMRVPEVLSGGSGDFRFYRYAGLLFAYWYNHDLATLLHLIELVRAGDVPGFDAKISELKADLHLQAAYDQYLSALIADIGSLDNPSTRMPPLATLDVATTADIQRLVRQTRIGYLADVSVAAVDANTRFSARGTLSGTLTTQQDTVAAWRLFDDNLDEMIHELEQQDVSNFIAVHGRFGRIRWVDYHGQTYPMADYVVEGPLPHGAAALQPPAQQVTMDFHATRLGANAQAALVNPATVEVHVSLTTTLHPTTTATSVLEAMLEDQRSELRNQVYAIRPPYYRSLEVEWDGPVETIVNESRQQKYALRKVLCTVTLP